MSTNAQYTFTVTETASYMAHFQQQTYTITATANPTNGGSVTGGGTYNHGQNCTLSAMPNEGYNFVNWTENGNAVSASAEYTFPVTANRNLVANFDLKDVTIKVTVNPAEGGRVSGDGVFPYGTSVTLTIETFEDYAFRSWVEDGVVISEELTFSFTATADRAITALLNHTLGIGEQNGIAARLYPNPVGDVLSVEANQAIDKVEIFNVLGALVYSQTNCSDMVSVTTTDLPSGAYVIRVTTDKAVETLRFVKE